MLSDLPAHVLRLDHTPARAAIIACHVPCARSDVLEPLPIRDGSRARAIFRLDLCRLCNGSRRSPDTGLPCEVCTLRPGSTYPVVP